MRKFLASLTVSLALFVGLAPAALAFSGGNPISCGLQSGINLNTSGKCPSTTQTNQYAALGDSVAAGLGLPLAANANATDKLCGRSPYGYPNLVAKQTGLQLVNASCSGAKVGDLFTKQAVNGPNIPAQLDTAFASGTPKLITITAGANDAHWADFIKACYAYNCNTASYRYAASAYISAMKIKLYYAFSSIQSRSHGNPPKVVITGYYSPFSAACANAQLTAAELDWLQNESHSLNAAIQDVAAHYPFVAYAPVDFTGHDVCSSSPWVQGPNDPAPFHPTSKGQQVLAEQIRPKL